MQRNLSRVVETAVALSLVLAIGCASATGTNDKGGGPAFGARDVVLVYDGGETCAHTDHPDPVIYKSGPFWKPKRVKWKPEVKNQYHWKITWKGANTGSGKNYLGPVDDIVCNGPQKTFSKSAKGIADPGQLEWHYSIGVFECDGTTPVCTADPVVWIDP